MPETAVLVGIEKYDQPGWDIAGPCASALAIINWLLSINTPPVNIHFFYAPIADYSQEIGVLGQAGVHIVKSGEFGTIDDFTRSAWADNVPPYSNLLFYWSGHGFVEPNGDRIFICSDYTADRMTNRVFHGSNFVRRLESDIQFQKFSEQIVLIDVCGVQSPNLRFQATAVIPQNHGQVAKQTTFFATPEGVYARAKDGQGAFSGIVLKVLAARGRSRQKTIADF